jgi:hypothetical protein
MRRPLQLGNYSSALNRSSGVLRPTLSWGILALMERFNVKREMNMKIVHLCKRYVISIYIFAKNYVYY